MRELIAIQLGKKGITYLSALTINVSCIKLIHNQSCRVVNSIGIYNGTTSAITYTMNKLMLEERRKNMRVGKVLWNVNKEAEGIVIDSTGNQFYFNASTSPMFDFALYNHLNVSFELKEQVGYGLVAWNVKTGYSS